MGWLHMGNDREGAAEGDARLGPFGRGAGRGSPNPAQRGRHDILESEDAGAFWNEVDGMLTGEFSADLLPRAGDYRLGAITDSFDPVTRPIVGGPPPTGSEPAATDSQPGGSPPPAARPPAERSFSPPPAERPWAPPAHPDPAAATPSPAERPSGQAHADPAAADPQSSAPQPAGSAADPQSSARQPASSAPADPQSSEQRPSQQTASDPSIGDPFAFDQLPGSAEATGEPTGSSPTAAADGDISAASGRRGAHDIDPDQLGFNVVGDDHQFRVFVPELNDGPFAVAAEAPATQPRQSDPDLPVRNVPTVSTDSTRLFDDTGGLPAVAKDDGGRLFPRADDDSPAAQLWAPGLNEAARSPLDGPMIDLTDDGEGGRTPPPPVALERSTVVDPAQGAPAGSSFLDDSAGSAGGQPGHAGSGSGHAGQAEHVGSAASAPAGSAPTINLQDLRAPARPPGAVRVPERTSGPLRRDILLDIVDRQWFTTTLVAVALLAIGVIVWALFAGADDGSDQIVAASTTTIDVSSASRDAGAASAAQTTTTTVASSTASTESVTSSGTVTTRATRRATTAPTRATSAPTSESTAPPTSDTTEPPTSSSDTTEPPTSSSDTTEPPTTGTDPPTTPEPDPDPGSQTP